MIDLDKINEKFKPVNDRILSIDEKFGNELTNELLERIEITLNQFFNEFKEQSSKSFNSYWEKQEYLKKENNKNEFIEETENVPKFISDYKNRKKK